MTIVVLVLASLALFVSLLTAAALVELHEYMRRGEAPEPVDRPIPVSLGEAVGTYPSSYGLPGDLDQDAAVLLFVSPSCPACYDLVQSFGSAPPDRLHVVIAAPSAEAASEWAGRLALPMDRCTVDPGHAIVDKLGLQATPVAIVVDGGRLSYGTSVPSAKWFSSLLQEVPA